MEHLSQRLAYNSLHENHTCNGELFLTKNPQSSIIFYM